MCLYTLITYYCITFLSVWNLTASLRLYVFFYILNRFISVLVLIILQFCM